jgi:Family of unknown function (DUF5338)
MTHPLSEALNALLQELPQAKTGFVKRFLPQIEDALAAGYSRKAVWETLHRERADLGYKEFCVYLGRLRRAKARSSGGGQRERTVRAPYTQQPPIHDPFANLRRAEAERTTFQWRGTRDLDELVYGKETDKAGS